MPVDALLVVVHYSSSSQDLVRAALAAWKELPGTVGGGTRRALGAHAGRPSGAVDPPAGSTLARRNRRAVSKCIVPYRTGMLSIVFPWVANHEKTCG